MRMKLFISDNEPNINLNLFSSQELEHRMQRVEKKRKSKNEILNHN
jgi:hypothetical protein